MFLLPLLFFVLAQFAQCSCPDGFELVSEGQCRGFYGTIPGADLHWNDATNTVIQKCEELQAQPVIIHNDEENSYWKNQSKSRELGYLLLGLICNATSTLWEWADGSPVDYKPSEGYNSKLDAACSTGCAYYLVPNLTTSQHVEGFWYGVCSTSYDSYPFHIHCTAQLPSVVPPDDCEHFASDGDDGVCYQIGTTAESWQDAQLICKKFGANLASIHNANENSFVRRLAVSKGAVHGVFLGATVSGKGGDYGWIDGPEWDYTNFYPGFPKSGYGECIALDTSVTSGQWMNVECSSEIPVACIREKITPIVRNSTCSYDSVTEGTIMTSPGFPYDASMPCDYYLEADEGKKVKVEIAILEANSCCDFLVLYEGYFGGFILANLTGEVRNVTYTTDSNKMRVSWQPNGGVNVRGVAMTFRGV